MISTKRRRFRSGVGINRLFIACNHYVQYSRRVEKVFEALYCTQQGTVNLARWNSERRDGLSGGRRQA